MRMLLYLRIFLRSQAHESTVHSRKHNRSSSGDSSGSAGWKEKKRRHCTSVAHLKRLSVELSFLLVSLVSALNRSFDLNPPCHCWVSLPFRSSPAQTMRKFLSLLLLSSLSQNRRHQLFYPSLNLTDGYPYGINEKGMRSTRTVTRSMYVSFFPLAHIILISMPDKLHPTYFFPPQPRLPVSAPSAPTPADIGFWHTCFLRRKDSNHLTPTESAKTNNAEEKESTYEGAGRSCVTW